MQSIPSWLPPKLERSYAPRLAGGTDGDSGRCRRRRPENLGGSPDHQTRQTAGARRQTPAGYPRKASRGVQNIDLVADYDRFRQRHARTISLFCSGARKRFDVCDGVSAALESTLCKAVKKPCGLASRIIGSRQNANGSARGYCASPKRCGRGMSALCARITARCSGAGVARSVLPISAVRPIPGWAADPTRPTALRFATCTTSNNMISAQPAFERKYGLDLFALAAEFVRRSPDTAMKEALARLWEDCR